jgi:amidase
VTDLAFTDAAELVELYRRRAASPVDAVEACLERIDAVDGVLNAYVTVDREGALEAARRAADAPVAGPLHGVPVGIKDLTETAGMRTTYGSRIFADHVPEADALVVERVKAAGAIILGKTNTPEFGLTPFTEPELFGPTHNPWDLTRTSGGSSGGSAAAVAAGMVPLAGGLRPVRSQADTRPHADRANRGGALGGRGDRARHHAIGARQRRDARCDHRP